MFTCVVCVCVCYLPISNVFEHCNMYIHKYSSETEGICKREDSKWWKIPEDREQDHSTGEKRNKIM